VPGTANLAQQLIESVRDLRAAQQELETRSREYAQAERRYRKAKAIAFLRSSGRNVTERESNAELFIIEDQSTLSDIRFERDTAEGLRVSALEAVRSYRGIVSALQSLASLERSEAELAKYGPQEAWGETP
jgi:hypothetical protein